MKVKELMRNRNLKSVLPEDTLAMAAKMMNWSDTRHLPVVSNGKVVGVLTEKDILKYRAETGGLGGFDPVERFMSKPPQVISPQGDVADAAAVMVARRIGCLPVVADGELVGMLTRTDILSASSPVRDDAVARVTLAMKRNLVTVRPSQPAMEAVGLMIDHDLRHIPVVDAGYKLVGIISDRDVRTAIGDPVEALKADHEGLQGLDAASLMTSNPVVISTGTSLANASARMLESHVSALPVIDEDGTLAGIVSFVDIIVTLEDLLARARSANPNQ